MPLNYSLVDQRSFFKRPETCKIDEIIEVIKNFDLSEWPYFGEDVNISEYVVGDQPLTHVQVNILQLLHILNVIVIFLILGKISKCLPIFQYFISRTFTVVPFIKYSRLSNWYHYKRARNLSRRSLWFSNAAKIRSE